MQAALRVVTDQHTPADSMGVVGAARSGSRRDLLVALRDQIAQEIDGGVPPRDLASLSLRLLAIAREIEEIDASNEGDGVGQAADTPDEPWPAG